jgi:hypothetical protein
MSLGRTPGTRRRSSSPRPVCRACGQTARAPRNPVGHSARAVIGPMSVVGLLALDALPDHLRLNALRGGCASPKGGRGVDVIFVTSTCQNHRYQPGIGQGVDVVDVLSPPLDKIENERSGGSGIQIWDRLETSPPSPPSPPPRAPGRAVPDRRRKFRHFSDRAGT